MVEPLEQSPAEQVVDTPRRSRTALWTALGVGVVAATLVGVLATRDPATTRVAESPLVGQQAPPIDGEPLVNGDFSLAANRGRWVVVNFFATWCVPCRQEHPDLVSFSRRHAATGDATVVSVVFKDRLRDVQAFFDEHGGEWPVIDDPRGVTALQYGVSGIPESYLVDPDGVVVAKLIGGVRADHLDALLARLQGGSSAGSSGDGG